MELTQNPSVLELVRKTAELTTPKEIVWIDGSEAQLESLRKIAVETGELIKLNEEKLPGCYLNHSDVNDVARVEGRTFICSKTREAAGPTNNWMDPDEMKAKLHEILRCAMTDRTMYVIPYSMGVIGTPFDAYRAARLIIQSVPVSGLCQHEDVVAFHLDDFLDDVREITLRTRYRSYPVLDGEGRVVGTLSRYHLLRPNRKRVVLVDHNETAQSVPGLEQAEIMEIIDHHRLADVQTAGPVYMRNEPVGSTATIIAGMYQEHGVMPSPNMAGLMAGAILSDTVMFKSPTCTKRDIAMAERMARIANVSLKELGNLIFAASSAGDKSAEDLCFADFKEFHIADHYLGVGQVTSLDSAKVLERKDELLAVMATKLEQQHYDMIALMVTDVLLEGTSLLYIGNDDTIRTAFSVEPKDSAVFLPGVMSRKKQIIPMLTALWG